MKASKKTISNEMLKSWIHILIITYLKCTIEQFEKTIQTLKFCGEVVPEWEKKIFLNHFKKQIYPLNREVLIWLHKNQKNHYDEKYGINYYDRYKELEKIFKNNKQTWDTHKQQ